MEKKKKWKGDISYDEWYYGMAKKKVDGVKYLWTADNPKDRWDKDFQMGVKKIPGTWRDCTDWYEEWEEWILSKDKNKPEFWSNEWEEWTLLRK